MIVIFNRVVGDGSYFVVLLCYFVSFVPSFFVSFFVVEQELIVELR